MVRTFYSLMFTMAFSSFLTKTKLQLDLVVSNVLRQTSETTTETLDAVELVLSSKVCKVKNRILELLNVLFADWQYTIRIVLLIPHV